MPTSSVQAATAAVARAHIGGVPEQIAAARAELKAAKLERAICAAVAEAPPLTDDQRRQLAALLFPSGGAR